MKVIKRVVEYLIAIAVIPAIILTVINVTELKDVINVQYELLSEEDGIFNVTPGTFNSLRENRRIKNYELESNYPLITQEEMDRATWELGDLKNEIYIDENGQKRIRLKVGQITIDGSEDWVPDTSRDNEVTEYYYFVFPEYLNIKYTVDSYEVVNAFSPVFEASSNTIVQDPQTTDEVFTFAMMVDMRVIFRFRIAKDRLNGRTVKEYFSQNPLTITYELEVEEDRPVETYDFSTFRLVFERNCIKVLFDVDDGYYLWQITKDDKMIPINGQYDLGNIWTVKFYVYEIQQPMIRTLVLLIPLIVISGVLLYMYNMLKKKDLMY